METDSSHAYNYCALPLAAYACRPDMSRSRAYQEPESRHRTAFQRDRDRIIHSSAFRRLKDKAQVLAAHDGDHFRTRLSHTLEVAQIAQTLARCLMANEDLAETVALAHDLGHPPFAHMGEDSLKICMAPWGGFAHNDQSLRILTTLERKYPLWPGLNLTQETLEGVAKHNGPLLKKGDGASRDLLSLATYELNAAIDLELHLFASIEAQIAAIADDIAYNNHDVEDGLREQLFGFDDILKVDLIRESREKAQESLGAALTDRYIVPETIRAMMGEMVDDVLNTTRRNLERVNPTSPRDIAHASFQIVTFSEEMEKKVNELRAFLFERMYHHSHVERVAFKVKKIISQLFHAFMEHYKLLPENWRAQIVESGGVEDESIRARIVCDYIAGMTDRYAVHEYARLFDMSFGHK